MSSFGPGLVIGWIDSHCLVPTMIDFGPGTDTLTGERWLISTPCAPPGDLPAAVASGYRRRAFACRRGSLDACVAELYDCSTGIAASLLHNCTTRSTLSLRGPAGRPRAETSRWNRFRKGWTSSRDKEASRLVWWFGQGVGRGCWFIDR